MEYASKVNQRFPYPFLQDLAPLQRSAFYVAMLPILLALFYVRFLYVERPWSLGSPTFADRQRRARFGSRPLDGGARGRLGQED